MENKYSLRREIAALGTLLWFETHAALSYLKVLLLPRGLRLRSKHSYPFLGSLEQKATSLSVPVSHLKLPAITALAYSSTRSKDWEDVLTAHTGETFARTWSVQEKKLGRWSVGGAERAKGVSTKGKGVDASLGAIKASVIIDYERLASYVTRAQAVCVSACGNFGFVGTTQGIVQSYNMQSGLKRRTYIIEKGQTVTGIATDALNRVLVASTLNGTIHVSTAGD
jgi:U3 small nucleolar RNA-associated protein 21